MAHKQTLPVVVLYPADAWLHVCPTVRAIGPLQAAGFQVVPGVEWHAQQLRIFPERVAQADYVLIQRDFPRHYEAYQQIVAHARAQGKPIIYEIDDLLFDLPAWHPDTEHYRKARMAMTQALVEADGITCSTLPLQARLRELNPRVVCLPNYLNEQLWQTEFQRSQEVTADVPSRPVIIGYCGGHSHLPDLEAIKPALKQVLDRYGNAVQLKFWGGLPPAELLSWSNVAWVDPGLVDYSAFAAYFAGQTCDIFIAPLRDDDFNQYKSGLKFLEYSALGVPGVYSRVPAYSALVTHGTTGFLATTTEEWSTYLTRLVEDAALRQRMGTAARQAVREQWLLVPHAAAWSEAYQTFTLGRTSSSILPVTLQVVRQAAAWYQESEVRIQEATERIQALERVASEHEQLKHQLQDLEGQLVAKDLQVQEIVTSPGWRLVEVLGSVRLRLAPKGGLRERLMYLGLHSLWVMRQEGVRRWLLKAIEGLKYYRKTGVLPQAPPDIPDLILVPGEPCPEPAISVIWIKSARFSAGIDEDSMLAWLASQTCRSTELVIWDSEMQVAYRASQSGEPWPADTVPALCAGVQGRYLCIVSKDLLQQPATYLEANVLALGTENSLFTVNVSGSAWAMMTALKLGRIPGGPHAPLLRQVVRTACLRDAFVLDVEHWKRLALTTNRTVGKLLTHSTNRIDLPDTLPFEGQIAGDALQYSDGYWLAAGPALPRTLHPVTSVYPPTPDPADIPTVLVTMPFLAVGGAERVAWDMMHALRHEIRFVLLTVESYDAALGTTADNFRQITPYVYTAPDYLLSALNESFVHYLIERFQPQTLYIANGANWIYDVLPALRQQYPALRTVNQVYDHQAGWINRYTPELVACLDGHISSNARISQAYRERGASVEQIHFIENGIDELEFDMQCYTPQQIQSVRQQLRIPYGHQVVTFIARLHPQKRPMDFVELARRCAEAPQVTFLMVGDGPLGAAVNAELEHLNLPNLIRHSFVPSNDVLAITDVMVLPSDYEGMPMTVLQAQAMGKAIVATDVGNNREVFALTSGGMVVSIGDVGAMRAAVLELLAAPPDPQAVRRAILSRFSLQAMVAKYRQALLRT